MSSKFQPSTSFIDTILDIAIWNLKWNMKMIFQILKSIMHKNHFQILISISKCVKGQNEVLKFLLGEAIYFFLYQTNLISITFYFLCLPSTCFSIIFTLSNETAVIREMKWKKNKKQKMYSVHKKNGRLK